MRSRTLIFFAATAIYATNPRLKIILNRVRCLRENNSYRAVAPNASEVMDVASGALLAIDVGGSTSRASVIDRAGHCLGQGRNRGGNPASNDPAEAAQAIISAVEAAVADAGGVPRAIDLALIALAGPQVHVARARLETAFRDLGLTGQLVFAGDLLAMFASASEAADGYCVVAGTGAGAVRIRGGAIERVVDANGWLLGDLGSGFWLGHSCTQAVVAHLDGRGEATALTPALLTALGIEWSEARAPNSRPLPLSLLVDAIYAMRPIELAQFAPLVIANRADPVAGALLDAATRWLVADFAAAFDSSVPGPVALGGGVMPHLAGVADGIAEIIRAAGHLPDIRPVADGSVGAAILALRAAGALVDAALFETISASIAARKAAAVGRR
jgi:N-acetylglucosamine kinase-like BadF-type ATPase